MKYICLAYAEENKLNSLTKSEWDSLRNETLAYVDELKHRGTLISAEPLQSVHNATTVRVRNYKLLVTDGPFAVTKEMLGSFFLIDATHLDEAIQIAVKWPSARLGSIEIRPIESELRENGRYESLSD